VRTSNEKKKKQNIYKQNTKQCSLYAGVMVVVVVVVVVNSIRRSKLLLID
jgi:hypothetical protein